MEQASALENTQALIYPGQLYFDGRQIERDLGKTAGYFVQAAELGKTSPSSNTRVFSCIQTLTDHSSDERTIGSESRESRQPRRDAGLGNLYARVCT
ncbi:MAG: hypothetical protein Ct9H300mP8_12580 [Gammaproteobacteria bacterium]|nr:MAG: hypothetical protein Ct9H300mP8_12580 [Gammaproteobacteria bacterium]